jgi:hypothetical protein
MSDHAKNETYTYDQVVDLANRAVELIIDELDLPETGTVDAMNLVVNAIGSLMRNPLTACLDDVIRDNYETDPEEVRSWAES